MIDRTVPQVVDDLEEIVDTAVRERSRLGVFPALYHRVTVTVVDGIAGGYFAGRPHQPRPGHRDRCGEHAMRVGIRLGRAEAWDFAEQLVRLSKPEHEAAVAARDEVVWRMGRLICGRYSLLHLANPAIAWRERHALGDVLAALGAAKVDLAALARPTS